MKKNNRIRVLHVAPLPPPLGGMVTYIQGLLGSDVFKEIDYKVVRFSYFNKEKFTGFIRFLVNIVNSLILTIVFLARVIFWRPNIVHIQSNSGFGYFEKSWIAFLAKFFGRKTIFHFHGGNFPNFYEDSSVAKKRLIKSCAMINDRILTGSPQMKQNWLNIGIPPDKIAYIGNAVNLPDISLQENRQGVNVLFLTRIVFEKGIIELIDAFVDLRKNFENINLRIVGAESLDTPEIIEHLDEIDKDHVIEYIGPVSDEQKHMEYLRTDIFAFPTYVEDQSYAIMEAMSYGLPCVASNVGGIPSLIKDGENGLLVKPKDVVSLRDSIKSLYTDLPLRQKLGDNARKTIEEGFTWKKRSQEIIALYNEILQDC